MIQNKSLKLFLGFLSFSFTLGAEANCPLPSQIESIDNGSHIVNTENGVWTQIENNQSYKSVDGERVEFSLFYVFGKEIKENYGENWQADQMICIYHVSNNKYVVLKSPDDDKFSVSSPKISNEIDPTGHWTKLQSSLACFASMNREKVNVCEFNKL